MIKSKKQSVSWWNKKYGKDKICAITKTRLRPGYSIFLSCKHGFNKRAFDEYKLTCENNLIELRCPLCRKNVNS
jgi:hypothetical protein